MENALKENLGYTDRFTRISIGIALSMSILLMPYQAAWIAAAAFAAVYPLLTGLTAIDPVLKVAESIFQKSTKSRKLKPTVVA